MPRLNETLTMYLPTSVGLLSPAARRMVDRILSNDDNVSIKIEFISDERWLEMVR